jgi:hypothetical protein
MENMENDELVPLYKLDIEVLKQEGYITNDMSNSQKYKMIRLNQQWLLCEESDDGIMCITKKRQWMLQNPDNFEYGLLGKNAYFVHCGVVGEGYIYGIGRWYDRMYYVKTDSFDKVKRARIHESDIYLTLDELFKALNTKYEIKEKK